MNKIQPTIIKRGAGFELTSELYLPHSLDSVFAFFAAAENLNRITPPFLHFRIKTSLPVTMRVGLRLQYRIRLHGVPLRWVSEITEWNPPFAFTDEQVSGPYRYWIHRHTFAAHGEGTLIQDQVAYAVYGGTLVHSLLVREDLQQVFAYRRNKIRAIFPADSVANTGN